MICVSFSIGKSLNVSLVFLNVEEGGVLSLAETQENFLPVHMFSEVLKTLFLLLELIKSLHTCQLRLLCSLSCRFTCGTSFDVPKPIWHLLV